MARVELSPSSKRALDNFIKVSGETANIPGFVFGITNLKEEIYFNGAGNHVVNDPTSAPVTPDSIFWICSQTKLIIALAALKLIEQGKITFETLVENYIPEMKNPVVVESTSKQNTVFRPAKTAVTVRHLMTFTSGLFYSDSEGNSRGLEKGYSSKEMHQAADPVAEFFQIIKRGLPGVPLKFEPGTDFGYGWSSDVLGFLVEKVSGQSLEQFCQENIFKPLGIRASFYLTPDLHERLVDLALRDENGMLSPWADQVKIIERDDRKVRIHFGGIGMYTSMRDYLKLLRHLLQLNAGAKVADPILTEESVRSLFIPTLSEKGAQSLSELVMLQGIQWSTGLAVTTTDWPDSRKKGSAFWSGWAGTHCFMDPDTGIAAVFGTQVVPNVIFDEAAIRVFMSLERLTYASCRVAAGL